MDKKQVYNRIFTEKKWKDVNKYNKDLMEDFLIELLSQKKKDGTIKQYKNDLRILFIFILEELDNKPIYKLKKKAFRNYVLWLSDKGMSNARINRLLSALRSMLEYASNEEDYEDEIEINYASKVKGLQKEKARDIVFLTDEEIFIIYEELKKQKRYSEALLCMLMYESAGRRNEIFQVKRNDISLDSNICKTPVVAKRGKTYRPIYNDNTKEAYKLLEENRKSDNNYLWITRNGEPASYSTLYAWVHSWRNILVEKDLPLKEFNPHSFRHSALENLENGSHYICKKLNKKFELNELKTLANHSDISTTASYLKEDDEEVLLQAFGL